MSTTGLTPATYAPPDVPLVLADAATFAEARALLARADFHEEPVAQRLGGTTLFGFPRLCDGRRTLDGPVEDAQAALVRLLLDGEPLEAARARALCGDAGIDALVALGVLARADDERLRATVVLPPVQGLWVASDRPPQRGERDGAAMRADVVFPALGELTRDFVATLPPVPAGARVLELCAGAGLAALAYARLAGVEAWATDIGARSVHFARFNAALSGVERAHAVVSDGWQALDGETFDLVCAHPPYVPSLRCEFEFRDGGTDGEQVTRALVEGLPAHLRPGGRASFTCALTDRAGEPIEARLRRWLGAAEGEFDVVVLQRREWDPMFAWRTATRGGVGYVDLERWLRQFDELCITRFALVALELRRHRAAGAARAPLTVRRQAGPHVDADALAWVAERARRDAEAPADPVTRLGAARPRVVPGAALEVLLRAEGDGWHTTSGRMRTAYPVLGAVPLPPLAPALAELCDGTRDTSGVLAALRDAGLVEDDVTHADVAALLLQLMDIGALETDDAPVPRAPARGTPTRLPTLLPDAPDA